MGSWWKQQLLHCYQPRSQDGCRTSASISPLHGAFPRSNPCSPRPPLVTALSPSQESLGFPFGARTSLVILRGHPPPLRSSSG